MLSQSFAVAAVVAGLSELGHDFLVVEASREAKKPKKDKMEPTAEHPSQTTQGKRKLFWKCNMPDPPKEISEDIRSDILDELSAACARQQPTANSTYQWGMLKAKNSKRKISYFRIADPIAHKHFRVYIWYDETQVVVLDVYDKNTTHVPQVEENKLWQRLSRC